MAKKSFDISSTLNKNKTQLADKIPLKKSAVNTEEVRAKVDRLHGDEAKKTKAPVKPKTKATKKSVEKSDKKLKLVRLTIDTPEGMHKKLKIRAIEKGISMRDYILQLLEKELNR